MKCPKCGGEILWDDTYDSQTGEDEYIELNCGHCGDCNTDFQWERHYKYAYDTLPVEE